MSQGQQETSRALLFLDEAYAMAQGIGGFEVFYDAAGALFFGPAGDESLNPLPLGQEGDSILQRHLARLDQMADARRQTPSEQLPTVLIKQGPARIEVSGNTTASDLLEITFPSAADGLGLTPRSVAHLEDLFTQNGPTTQEITIKRQGDDRAYFGRLYALDDATRMLTLAVFTWTPERLVPMVQRFGLTSTEADVLMGLLQGQTQGQVAEARGRSVETVKSQSKAILRKCGVARVAELAAMAVALSFLGAQDAPLVVEDRSTDILRPRVVPEIGDDRNIAILEAGRPGGRPVLFAHGLPFGPFLTPEMDACLRDANLHFVGPSRPAFGETSPPEVGYDAQTVADALAAAAHVFGSDAPITLVAHQGGTSHAVRISNALGSRAQAILLVGGGIPITEAHIQNMSSQIRVIAAATRHAPRVMEMILRLGIRFWLRKGPRAYLTSLFSGLAADTAAIEDETVGPALEAGILHMIAQGHSAFMMDGASAMADWLDDYRALSVECHWLVAGDNGTLSVDAYREFLDAEFHGSVQVEPDAGLTIWFTDFEHICRKINAIAAV